ncbi:MAG TPA: alpha-glucan family phosphorylase, partial [Minicystis sp.]|nr:alpha-glucan family phosphorylase [Minicystis sp.]
MITLHRFEVSPDIPRPLEPLVGLAKNLWWSWNESARELFARIDRKRYEELAENPLALLAQTPGERLAELAADAGYIAELARVTGELEHYMTRETWFERALAARGSPLEGARIAYFSMEFGIHECLPVYSGGLGVLAGDHLKSASDLGLPLVGVGVAFSQGYFRQSLDPEGWQNERYPPNDWHDLPVSAVVRPDGGRVVVSVALPAAQDAPKTREVRLQAWRVDVGRVPLFLLDANVEENALEDRALTNTLYGGDRNHRIRQEILLGVGGVRMLAAIGLRPTVCHMNEGHSAFLALERVRELMAETGAPFVVAAEAAAAGNVFTTHTPVPAGNDGFPHDLIAPYTGVLAQGLGLTAEDVQRIGRVDPAHAHAEFSMPVLAIRMADRYNGVSVLHGREARAMWRVLWPDVPEDEIPIGSITNGVHLGTWTSRPMAELYARYLGEDWIEHGADAARWAKIAEIPDEEIWAVREAERARLVAEIPARMRAAGERKGRRGDVGHLEGVLDPRALTIGFARRFATYKRGTLLLRDPERLLRIVSRHDRPVQLVFSGKAHPQDWGGKELIRDIVRASRSDAFRGRIVFVEDYDMGVARALVSGVDVWLNTPRRPLEASGTSGMKAALNGGLHASVLDGWWAEAYGGDNGFAIGHGEEYADTEYGDRVEAQLLYRLLEDQLVPLFYDRDATGLPRGWIARIKRSIVSTAPVFNTTRMVREYAEGLYEPAARRQRAMTDDGLARARAVCAWKARVATGWKDVRIEAVVEKGPRRVLAGQPYAVAAEVHLGGLSPADVVVELWHGRLRGGHALARGASIPLTCVGEIGGARYRFEGALPTREPGEHAVAV